ncbi:MAG: DUF488 family protein [Gemmatimonadaceae bacterium]
MLFDRQKHLLALLSALGGRIGNLDFQKLLLLYCTTESQPAPYEFVPYKFGAFSFTSYADRRRLIEKGLLANDDHIWELTAVGTEQAGRLRVAKDAAARFAYAHRDLRGDALVAETYRRYPYYAIRSEIAERVLHDDQAALSAVAGAVPPKGAVRLATIGYEGKTLEAYLNTLLHAGVTLLCDVRRNPLSRKYGFSKGTLSKGCAGVGIKYEHLPELGIESDKRKSLETQADYDALFVEYVRDTLPAQAAALERVRGWIRDGEAVALTCYERLPTQCHRHCVSDALADVLGPGITPTHL